MLAGRTAVRLGLLALSGLSACVARDEGSAAQAEPAQARLELPPGLPSLPQMGSGTAFDYAVAPSGDLLVSMVRHQNGSALDRDAELELGQTADRGFLVRDTRSGMAIRVSLPGARPARGLVQDATIRYSQAWGPGSELILIPGSEGVEDFLLLNEVVTPEVAYTVDVSRVAGLRLVDGVLEFLSEDGVPRLRVAQARVLDRDGREAKASLDLEGCQVDRNPSAPWTRTVVPPGSTHCAVSVRWDSARLTPPVLVDPAWTTTASMSAKRLWHAATLLNDGDVLISGGRPSETSPEHTSAELYHPETASFAATSPMGSGRSGLTLTTLDSGSVLAAAGGSETAELYNPSTGLWASTGSMAIARTGHSALRLKDGRVLVVAGNSATAELFLPDTGTWIPAGTVPSPSTTRPDYPAALLGDGRVLVAGGVDCQPLNSCQATGRAYVYDPNAGTWSTAGNISPRAYHSMASLSDGSVVVAGGVFDVHNYPNGTLSHVNNAERFVPGSGWESAGGLQDQCGYGYFHTALVGLDSGTALLTGGRNPGCTNIKNALVYEPGVTTWLTATRMSSDRHFHTATRLASGSALIAGGTNMALTTALSSAEVFGRQPLGAPCQRAGDCLSAHCIDQVCCDQDCDALCKACTAARKGFGSDGTCAWIKDATDPDNECAAVGTGVCASEGVCNGAGVCRALSQGQACVSSSCGSALTQINADTCSEAGTCLDNGTSSCAPYTCSGSACLASCASSVDCAPGNACVGNVCGSTKPDGFPCTAGDQCSSGHCVHGMCCDTACNGKCLSCRAAEKLVGADGVCGAARPGTDPYDDCGTSAGSCGPDGLCDGLGACRGNAAQGTSCAPPSCSGASAAISSCDGSGVCLVSQNSCLPYVCAAGACLKTCASSGDCASGYFCKAGACTALYGKGVACSLGEQCESSICVDGRCCNTSCAGPCVSCSGNANQSGIEGECGPVKAGSDPRDACPAAATACGADGMCNGAGECTQFKASGAPCGADSCNGSKLMAQQCDGFGTCAAVQSSDCGPFKCEAGACLTTCDVDGDCADGFFCSSGTCTAPHDTGHQCTSAAQCSSGFCVDGVCCETSCEQRCFSCSAALNTPGKNGVCAAVKSGNPEPGGKCSASNPTGPCDLDGRCDGNGNCTYAPSTTPCGQPSCASGSAIRKMCDGFGACQESSTPCAPYSCDPTTRTCKGSCSNNEDCASGSSCDLAKGQCASIAGSCDGAVLKLPDGNEIDCSPYRCSGNTCGSTCSKSNDCASGFSCSGGLCVAGGLDGGNPGSTDVTSDEGCGCRMGPGRNAFAVPLGLILGAAIAWRRRRRSPSPRSGPVREVVGS